jgi:hypothetical protein
MGARAAAPAGQKHRGWRPHRDPVQGVWELVIEPLLRRDEDRVLEATTILELREHDTRASSVRDNSAHYNAACETGARFTAPTARRSSSKFIHPAAKPRSTFRCDRILAGVIFEPPNIVNHQDARVGSCVGRYTEAELAGLCLHGGNHTRGLAPTKQQPRQALRLAGLFTSSRITRERTPFLHCVDTAAVQTKTKCPTVVGFGGPKRFVTRRCRSKSGTNSRG